MSTYLDRSIYRYIFRNSGWSQLLLVIFTLASLPVTYASLEVPKQIINTGIEAQDLPSAVFGVEVTQIEYLLLLCFLFLLLVFVNGAFKYVINVFKGVVAERLLSQLRHELFRRVLRFPLPHFKRLSQGEIIAMTTAETEPVGNFIGDSVAEPALQGGVLLTYLLFIFNQDPFLGAAAIALYPVQMWLVPKLQRRVNELGRQRVRTVRQMANRVGENVTGIAAVHAHGTARYELSDIGRRLKQVFHIRYDIYKRKFLIKFLNNFLASVTPFFFYSAGGYFVIVGELSMGALVAVLAAYKDLNPPWKALLKYYQTKEDVRIKYEQIIEQFDVAGMRDPELLTRGDDTEVRLNQAVKLSHVSLAEEGQDKSLDDLTLEVPAGQKLALTGPGGGGKSELVQLIARLDFPTAGSVRIGEHDMARLPESALGRRLGFVGQQSYLFAGTVYDNLAYGLKQRPSRRGDSGAAQGARQNWLQRLWSPPRDLTEADDDTDWIDYELAGVADAAGLSRRMIEVVRAVGLEHGLYELGLQSRIDPKRDYGYSQRLVEARQTLHRRLREQGMTDVVEPFDAELYNANATVAENLLFGLPLDEVYATDQLASNAYVQRILKQVGIYQRMVEVGRKTASTMVELFADLPPDHEFFEQFGFISANDLPTYRSLLARVDKLAPADMTAEDQQRLLALAFKLIPQRHRLGLIDDELRGKLVEARKEVRANLPAADRHRIAFFDADSYNPAAPVLDNVLMGKVVYGAAHARERVRGLVEEVLDSLDMREVVLLAGLDYDVGVGGGRLFPGQRKKLSVAAALLKSPDLMALDEPGTGLDATDERQILDAVMQQMAGRTVIWAISGQALLGRFDRVVELDGGHLGADRTPASGPGDDGPGDDGPGDGGGPGDAGRPADAAQSAPAEAPAGADDSRAQGG